MSTNSQTCETSNEESERILGAGYSLEARASYGASDSELMDVAVGWGLDPGSARLAAGVARVLAGNIDVTEAD